MPSERTGGAREQRLAAAAAQNARATPSGPDRRKAMARVAIQARCEQVVAELRRHGWTDVSCETSGKRYVLSGTSPTGERHATNSDNSRAVIAQILAAGGSAAGPAEEPAPAPEPQDGETVIMVDDRPYSITPADALKLSGAFMIALNSGETSVELESGEILVVTPANATAIAEQLAGG